MSEKRAITMVYTHITSWDPSTPKVVRGVPFETKKLCSGDGDLGIGIGIPLLTTILPRSGMRAGIQTVTKHDASNSITLIIRFQMTPVQDHASTLHT